MANYVPESVKQAYLDQMLDYYSNVKMQHKLLPEEWERNIPGIPEEYPFLSGPREHIESGTRYVTAPMDRPTGMPEHLKYGDIGPDYSTMSALMKAKEDPNFNLGFMTDEYMKEKTDPATGRLKVGAYFSPSDQTAVFNPNKLLDFNDLRVQEAFATEVDAPPTEGIMGVPREKKGRDLSMLEGTTLNFGGETGMSRQNWQDVAHEIGGHYPILFDDNMPRDGITANKFQLPNWTKDINMTKFGPNDPGGYDSIDDPNIMDVQGHNLAYWLGRGHQTYWDPILKKRQLGGYNNRTRDMYLTAEGAQNYGALVQHSKNYIKDFNNPPRQLPFVDRPQQNQQLPERSQSQFSPHNIGNVSGPVTTVSQKAQVGPPGYNYNTGGIASLRR